MLSSSLLSTGSHFQSVFQTDKEFFIQYSLHLEAEHISSGFAVSSPKASITSTEPSVSQTKKQEDKISNLENNKVKSQEGTNKDIDDNINELLKIKPKNRSESQKKELNKLRQELKRENPRCKEAQNETSKKGMQKLRNNSEKRKTDNEKEASRKSKVRENSEKRKDQNKKEMTRKKKVREVPEIRKNENEKEKLRKNRIREDSEKRKIENKKDIARKKQVREDSENRKIENEKRNASNNDKEQVRIKSYRRVAVLETHDTFSETQIADHIKSNYLGSLFDKSKQCDYCEAFRFEKESDFCCRKGDIEVEDIPEPPEQLRKMYENKTFTNNLRGYNNILAMASIGCETPDSMKGPNFKIQGKLYHSIGSLLPVDGQDPKFLQLYFYDIDEATDHRLKVMPKLDSKILKELTQIIESTNNYVKSFKAVLEYEESEAEIYICLISDKKKIPAGEHVRKYNLPQGCEVAALMPGDGDGELEVVVRDKNNKLTRINRLHRSYDPLLYVVADPYGTDGFTPGQDRAKNKNLKVSIADFYSYRIQVRPGFNQLLRSKRCFQQYLVDQGAKIEGARLKWAADNQKTIKAEKYCGLVDAANEGDLTKAGRKIILPPTITGSPRFYVEKYQDGMAMVRKFGKPTLFITMTCNPEWIEIQESLNEGETAFDRPDICTRVFKLKNDQLINDIVKNEIFGKAVAHMGTIEQQKRKGLHHSHNLIILEKEFVPRSPEDIDRIISAEIPDPEINPKLHSIITKNNMHGPCGKLNLNSPCMETADNGVKFCSKEFPKKFQKDTTMTEYSYPEYRRRSPEDGGRTVTKVVRGNPITLDNRYVVPYNSFLSLKNIAHVNVELLTSVVGVKYIFKYITKGPDRCIMTLKGHNGEGDSELDKNDEIENFVNARYLGASESVLKIFKFPVTYRSHSVVKLPCHLPGEQSVFFEEGGEEDALDKGPPETKLTAFFKANAADSQAKDLLYTEFPGHYNYQKGKWEIKKRSIGKAIGRIPTVSLCAKQMEIYSLRILLNNVKGPTCFEDLRTVDGILMDSFHKACQKLGLLEDDSEVENAMREAASVRFGDQFISFFGSLLELCRPGDPFELWNTFKEDLLHHSVHVLKLNKDVAENIVLLNLKNQLSRSGCSLKEFNLPEPKILKTETISQVILSETSYDKEMLLKQASLHVEIMNKEQHDIFQDVVKSVEQGQGKMFCVFAAGGTGKTFVVNTLLDAIRGDGLVALATASSGVAAQLLHKGTTIHSRFKVPFNITATSTCSFNKSDATGKLIGMTKLIIFDEMTMQHKHVYECVDRSLREITGLNSTFGGKTVVFSGDWRQCLPIIKHGGRGDIVNACLTSSYLWKSVIVRKLIRNMRVELKGESREFSDFLLQIGDGEITENRNIGESMVLLPEELFIKSNSGNDLVEEIFPDFKQRYQEISWIKNRAILCPTNEECAYINSLLLDQIPGDSISYKSCDSVSVSESHMYPQEFLNTIDLQGIPPHHLKLKSGAIIMLLRNMNPSEGHVNGTRYVVQNLLPHVIDATAISGSNVGAKLFIPRIWLATKDATLPFEMKRKQFPVKLAYSLTANKAQGQTLEQVGIFIGREFFSHGQLYVALSRVGSISSVKILFKAENKFHVKNVVYKEVINKVNILFGLLTNNNT